TCNLPTANGLASVTWCRGSSISRAFASPPPMMNEPAGTTTISGHLSHSLKTSLGLRPHSSPAVSGFGARNDDRDTLTAAALPHGLAGCGRFAGPPAPPPPPARAPPPR